MKKIFFGYIFLAIIFSSCGSATSIPISETPTQTISPEVLVTHPDLEVITPENVKQLEEIDRWGKGYSRIVFSPDEKFIGISSPTGIYIYNIETKEETVFVDATTKEEDTSRIKLDYPSVPIAFSSDSKQLAVSISSLIYIYEIESKKVIRVIFENYDIKNITNIEYSLNDKSILIQGSSKTNICYEGNESIIVLYDFEENKRIFEKRHCEMSPSYSKFISLDGREYFSFFDNEQSTIKIVDTETGEIGFLYQFDELDYYPSYDISPDGEVIAIKMPNNISQIVDLSSKKIIENINGYIYFLDSYSRYYSFNENSLQFFSNNENICEIPMNENERYFSSFSEGSKYYLQNQRYIWNINQCAVVGVLSDFPIGLFGLFTRQEHFNFSSDGELLVIFPRLFNTVTGKAKTFIDIYKHIIDDFAISDMKVRNTNSEILILVSDVFLKQSKILYFHVSSGELIKVWGYNEEFNNLVISHDETKIYTIANNGYLFVINAESGEIEIKSKITHPTGYKKLSLSPDGLTLALITYFDGSINGIDFIDLASLLKVNSVFAHQPNTKSIALSPNWDNIAIPQSNGEIYIFTPKNELVSKLLGHDQIQSEKHQVSNIMYTPNGKLLISQDFQRIRFWNVETSQLVAELQPDFTYKGFSISPDGYLLAILCNDGTVRVFGVKK